MKIDLTFWLIMVLSASVMANFIAVYYIRQLLGRLFAVGENLVDLVDLLSAYRNHLKGVYEMEMFYGDETLKFLLGHTRDLVGILEEDYADVYTIVEPLEQPPEETKEENKEDAEKTINKENVFYAGARESNN